MKVTIEVNGQPVEIEISQEQINKTMKESLLKNIISLHHKNLNIFIKKLNTPYKHIGARLKYKYGELTYRIIPDTNYESLNNLIVQQDKVIKDESDLSPEYIDIILKAIRTNSYIKSTEC